MKKRYLKIVLIAMCSFSIVGCGKTGSNEMKQSKDVATADSVVNDDFEYDTSDIDGENYMISTYSGTTDDVIIPDKYRDKQVVEIGDHAFSNTRAQIKKVQLGSHVQVIEEHAFSSNADLKDVVLNEGLKYIEKFAFLNSGLTGTMVIPDSVETIGTSAFGLTKIENVEFGKNIKNIAGGAFSGNTNLKRAIFNNMDVKFEDETVFGECPNLTIVAPKGSTAEKYAKDNNINYEER